MDRFKSWINAFLCVALLAQLPLKGADPLPDDPAHAHAGGPLTADEEKACRELFNQLAHEDFDTREGALTALVAKGPRVLTLAGEFAGHKDRDIADHAKNLHRKIMLNYDGYLPTSPKLLEALAKPRGPLPAEATVASLVEQLAKDHQIKIVIDLGSGAETVPLQHLEGLFKTSATTGQMLDHAAKIVGAAVVPRGDTLLITTHETAQKLLHQRLRLNIAAMELTRDDLERVTTGLARFFPVEDNELNATTGFLLATGHPDALARAARLAALLTPDSPDRIYPAPPEKLSGAEMLERLAAPVTVQFESAEIEKGLGKGLENAGVLTVGANGGVNAPARPPAEIMELKQFAPLRLTLRDVPLGYALKWIERRAKSPQMPDLTLAYELSATGRIQVRPVLKTRRLLEKCVAGADVRFLYPPGVASNPNSDAEALKTLQNALEPQLALFPNFSAKRDMLVLRSRVVMLGDAPTLQRALELIALLRNKEKLPETTWDKELTDKLDRKIEWDATGLSGSRTFHTVRKLGEISFLFEDAPDGTPASFKPPKDAELLPPGVYPLRKLLDVLCVNIKARWSVDCGAIVLTPLAEQK